MEIKTRRCAVRRFEEKDIPAFMEYRNDEAWMRYQGFKGLTREAYTQKLLGEHSYVKGAQLAIIRSADDCLIGDIYLKQEKDTFWLGCTVSPTNARNGYAYEVVAGVLALLKQKGCACVMAGVLPENTASINLLKKLAFTYIATDDDSGEQTYALREEA